jgi:hypothetical protein
VIIAGIETSLSQRQIANSPPARNPQMPCPNPCPNPCRVRPGLDSISSFDNTDIVHGNVCSTGIVRGGSKIDSWKSYKDGELARFPCLNFAKRLDGYAGFRGFNHWRGTLSVQPVF